MTEQNKNRRVVDKGDYDEFESFIENNSVEKTLAIYGIEFYTRVCFRKYQFGLLIKLIEKNMIQKKKEFQTIKTMLQKVRVNSDKDLNLQKYASDINNLEKVINEKIKSM